MIRYIQVENFKSLKKVSFSTDKLNLLFGMNGMGKSSIIQSLLLLRQSYWSRLPKGLHALNINGSLTSLGTFSDILCQNADKETVRFVLAFDAGNRIDVSYSQQGISFPSSVVKIDEISNAAVSFSDSEPLFGKGFCYLAAGHIEPQSEYSAVGWDIDGVNSMGRNGEYVVPYLAVKGDEFTVPKELCDPRAKTDKLLDQVSAWMSLISPGVRIGASYLPYEERAKLDISYEGKRMQSTPFLPVNVGFGVPYVLPLIVALLTADQDGLLIIENPESHLHPKGQEGLAKLMAKVAARGTQIICESHSDHIINGIRVAVKRQILSSEELSVLYFDHDDDQLSHVTEIEIDSKGNLSEYPSGLLDEWGILMSSLL